jgi:hypothetical protein
MLNTGQENDSWLVRHGSRVGGDESNCCFATIGPDIPWSLRRHYRTAAMQAILNLGEVTSPSPTGHIPPLPNTHTHTGEEPRKRCLTKLDTILKRWWLRQDSCPQPGGLQNQNYMCVCVLQPFWCSQDGQQLGWRHKLNNQNK